MDLVVSHDKNSHWPHKPSLLKDGRKLLKMTDAESNITSDFEQNN